ncbi:MAG TPA: hypothetical protein VLF18_08530 [Tahibacter sp.]|uniref:hypothetical protein n=1 Tax=Tahibacter sp. TaxID=2056211 RepID=UPI002C61F3D2|nr:hypothetical protein [Tahibacter sp.]HSX60229.1 hypothetical protein [Tahibacter sp.]
MSSYASAAVVSSCCHRCEGDACIFVFLFGSLFLVVLLALTWGADARRWAFARGYARRTVVAISAVALLAATYAVVELFILGMELLR